jgi:hypothetical protein
MKIINKKYIVLMMCSLVLVACSEDFLDKKPTEFVGQADATATADNLLTLLNGIHRSMYLRYENQNETGVAGVMQAADILGEDVVFPVNNGWFLQYYNWQANTNQNGQDVRFPYRTFYQINRNANIIIASADAATGSQATKNIVKGQALVYLSLIHI